MSRKSVAQLAVFRRAGRGRGRALAALAALAVLLAERLAERAERAERLAERAVRAVPMSTTSDNVSPG